MTEFIGQFELSDSIKVFGMIVTATLSASIQCFYDVAHVEMAIDKESNDTE